MPTLCWFLTSAVRKNLLNWTIDSPSCQQCGIMIRHSRIEACQPGWLPTGRSLIRFFLSAGAVTKSIRSRCRLSVAYLRAGTNIKHRWEFICIRWQAFPAASDCLNQRPFVKWRGHNQIFQKGDGDIPDLECGTHSEQSKFIYKSTCSCTGKREDVMKRYANVYPVFRKVQSIDLLLNYNLYVCM